MSVNTNGVLYTAQAAGRQMVRLGLPGSIILIASMSGTITNIVRLVSHLVNDVSFFTLVRIKMGKHTIGWHTTHPKVQWYKWQEVSRVN
jgi:NAD(P)-dependent dehydrogenase (short-subunit alcohol dehydrogenase family)